MNPEPGEARVPNPSSTEPHAMAAPQANHRIVLT